MPHGVQLAVTHHRPNAGGAKVSSKCDLHGEAPMFAMLKSKFCRAAELLRISVDQDWYYPFPVDITGDRSYRTQVKTNRVGTAAVPVTSCRIIDGATRPITTSCRSVCLPATGRNKESANWCVQPPMGPALSNWSPAP